MFKRIASFASALVLSLSSLFVFAPMVAHAATVTWDGDGADNNFTTATNWSGNAIPVNGDILVFPTSVDSDSINGDDRVLVNDMTNLTVGGLQVSGTYATGDHDRYKITGNAFSSSGNITGNGSSPAYTHLNLTVGLTLTANVTLQSVDSTSSIAIGSNTVTLSNSYFSGAHSGTGGSLILSGLPESGFGGGGGCGYSAGIGSPAFASTITINSNGSLGVTTNNQGLAFSASSITLNNGGLLSFSLPYNTDLAFNKGLTLNGGTIYASQGGDEANECKMPTVNKQITIPGNVTLTADTKFSLYDIDIKFSGTVTGKEFIKPYFESSGKVIFNDGSTIVPTPKTTEYTADSSATAVYVSNNETAVITGKYGATYINKGGTLKGNGTMGTLFVFAGGKLAPGLSPGCLSSGNLSFVSGSTYEVEIGGPTACTEYDQTKVTGTVTLGNATLNTILFNGFKPVKDQSYKIIDNDSTDAVSGTFLNLAEGATFTVDGFVLKISYIGDTGNDVVLTVISVPAPAVAAAPAPAAPATGFGAITSNPASIMMATTLIAGGILAIARRYNMLKVVK